MSKIDKGLIFAFGFLLGGITGFFLFKPYQKNKIIEEKIAEFWAECYVEQRFVRSEAGTMIPFCPDSLYVSDSLADTIWVGTFPGFISGKSIWTRFVWNGKSWIMDSISFEKPKGGKKCQ